jgi:hypothetical protein
MKNTKMHSQFHHCINKSTTLIQSNQDRARGRRPLVTSISTPKKVYHWRNQEREARGESRPRRAGDNSERCGATAGAEHNGGRRGSGEIQI